MKCAICGSTLGHPDAYCEVCWSDGSNLRGDRDLWGHTASERDHLEAEYNRAMEAWYDEEMREMGATMGCA